MSSQYNKIVIVGSGLLGSMIAHPLVAYAVSLDVGVEVMLVDYDKVEKRNSPSNLGVPGTIGKAKIGVMEEVYMIAGINTTLQPVRVTEKNLWLFKDADIIIGALDNVETRQLLLAASSKYGVPYIDLGLSFVGGNVTWSFGETVTMPFAGETSKDYVPSADKKPACELVGTRIYSAIATECAVTSVFIYIAGHDPANVAFQAIGREASQGDMINWYISTGEKGIMAKPVFVGKAIKKEDANGG